MKTHYVYKLEHPTTKEFYFGSRTCEDKPEDDNYMGSMIRWKPNKSKLIKTIIKSGFENRIIATQYEADLITEHIKNPLNRNYHIPPDKFCGGIGGRRIKYHPFSNQKDLKKFKKHYNIKCNKNGSNVDWTKWKHQAYEFDMYLYGFWSLPNIDIQKIPTSTRKVGKLLFTITECKMSMTRPTF